nr:TlpA disulfide reductase family protein [Thermoanaerobaculia bacterium]
MLRQPSARLVPWLLSSLALVACSSPPASTPSLVGIWRAVLTSPGGELPFGLEIQEQNGKLQGAALNGEERAPFSRVELQGRQAVLAFDWYDSRIEASLSPDGQELQGAWTKTIPGGVARMPFAARRGAQGRFGPAPGSAAEAPPAGEITGSWAAEFKDDSSTDPAQAELVRKDGRVLGTFLTPTGDYRYLEGSYQNGLLRLSTFDGAHAFLFQAKLQADGSLVGDFWSRETYHATWKAHPVQKGEIVLPDAWSQVGLKSQDGKLHFRFPDLEGHPVGLGDPRFAGKVVVVTLFGSWCPNCNDEAPILARWYRELRAQGLEVVGLAYEYSGDPARDREMVRRYASRHGIDYTLPVAGTSDKAEAAKTLPELSSVVAFP